MKKVTELQSVKSLQISDYSYVLPDERIAKYPLENRDESKLLCYKGGRITSYQFDELPLLVPDNSLMLFNNTRVIHARIYFEKETGATIEVFCLTPHIPVDYHQSFEQRERVVWSCMVGNARRWKDDVLELRIDMGCEQLLLKARKLERHGGEFLIEFSWDDPRWTFSDLLEEVGELPIPPYLNRETELEDDVTYQTVYSSDDGSVAAPTAGLHFTPKVLGRLGEAGVKSSYLTLHVGAGTFRPVKAEYMEEHSMHTEFISFSRDAIEDVLMCGESLIVVGTTSLRAVESLYYIGVKISRNPNIELSELEVSQWEPYKERYDLSGDEALEAVLTYMDERGLKHLYAQTQIMIAPGYQFRYPAALVTNFHQPQSTLLLLVAAFVGDGAWRDMYDYALSNDFRFLSYGDSSILWREKESN